MNKRFYVPWKIKDILMVFGLRFVLLWGLGRGLIPFLPVEATVAAEIADRMLVVVIVWFFVRFLRGGSLKDLGLGRQNFYRAAGLGLAAGLVLFLVSTVGERLYAALLSGPAAEHPVAILTRGAVTWRQLLLPLFLGGLAAPVSEELLYRGFSFPPLYRRFGLAGGTVLSAVLFAILHFNVWWLAEITLVGVGLALLYYWTGSLVAGIVAHSFVNTAKILLIYLGVI